MADVREFFDESIVPDRCLNCPGIQAAIGRLTGAFEIATTAATQDENADNPLASGITDDGRGQTAALVGSVFANMAQRRLAEATGIAKALTDKCPDGATPINDFAAIEHPAPAPHFGRPAAAPVTAIESFARMACNSQDAIAYFVPPGRGQN